MGSRPSLPAMSRTKTSTLQRVMWRRNSCPRAAVVVRAFNDAGNVRHNAAAEAVDPTTPMMGWSVVKG